MADVEGWEVGTFYGHKVYKVGHYDLTFDIIGKTRKRRRVDIRHPQLYI